MKIKFIPPEANSRGVNREDSVSAHAARIVARMDRMASKKKKTGFGSITPEGSPFPYECGEWRFRCQHCFDAAGKRIFIACPKQ